MQVRGLEVDLVQLDPDHTVRAHDGAALERTQCVARGGVHDPVKLLADRVEQTPMATVRSALI